jgi:CheY-like chemotaxis protein
MERKALLVEDNENNRYLLTLLLKAAGVTVVIAENGRSAIEAARRELPDVILMDLQMPEMDVYEVAAHLKRDAELARIPIVGVSSFAMPGDREKALRMGFAGYIEKPVDPEHFVETVIAILAGAGGTA